MSLIDEALRRARQEAARQDSAKREAQYRQVPVYAQNPQRSARPVLLGAAVALCIVAGVGIGVLLGRGGGEKEIQEPLARSVSEAPESPSASIEEPGTVSLEESSTEPEPTPSPLPAIQRQEVPAAAAEPVQPPPILDPEPPPSTVLEPKPAAPAPEVSAPETPPAPEIRTYVREVPLPDGGTLRLSGIAFSAAQPVALINDKVLAKGETYQGFVVADIQANLVELRGNGMTVRVTLK